MGDIKTTNMSTSNCKFLILAFALLAVANATSVFTISRGGGCPTDDNSPAAVTEWPVGTCVYRGYGKNYGKVTLSGSTYSYQEYGSQGEPAYIQGQGVPEGACDTAGRSDTAISGPLDTCVEDVGCCVDPTSRGGTFVKFATSYSIDMMTASDSMVSEWDCTSGECKVWSAGTNSASHATVGAIAALIGLVANLFVY